MNYKQEIQRSMDYLSKKNNTIFLGQSVLYPGNSMFGTLENIPKKKKIEMPVFEDVQMGISLGLALDGYIPITCFPRFDFLILAANQIVNHLDKINEMSDNIFKPRVMIRTSVGSKNPLNGGPQHTQDHSTAFQHMLKNIKIIKLKKTKDIFKAFYNAYNDKNKKSYLFIEYGDFYNNN